MDELFQSCGYRSPGISWLRNFFHVCAWSRWLWDDHSTLLHSIFVKYNPVSRIFFNLSYHLMSSINNMSQLLWFCYKNYFLHSSCRIFCGSDVSYSDGSMDKSYEFAWYRGKRWLTIALKIEDIMCRWLH